MAPHKNGCVARHHAHVRHRREEALAVLAAAVRAVEDRVVLGLQVRRALDRHAPDDGVVRLVDLRPR